MSKSLTSTTKPTAVCTYAADVNDWVAWGGDPTLWGIVLRELGVDGNVWRCPHAAVAEDSEGAAKCVFHLPPYEVPDRETAQAFRDVLMATVGASDVWARRLKQFIGATFDNVTLDYTQLATAHVPLYLIGATVTDDLTMAGPIRQRIVAPLTTFEGRTDFANATFEREADFQNATFEREADFQNATFEREADFQNATFEREADFRNATFERRVNFRMTTFQDSVDFEDATFERRLVFDDATFTQKPNFAKTTFQDGCECGRDRTSGPCLD